MKFICLLLPIALAVAALPTVAQNRIYVNHAATGANTGATWSDAHTDLTAALAQAEAGDEVWVAQGTYRPTTGTVRSTSFAPKSGVRLYGGFAGVEVDLSQRDWVAHATVLSGDIGVPGDSTDNSYNVVYLHRPDLGTVLDGFVVRDGNATDTQAAFFARDRAICGGGLYIMAEDAEAYPDITNCRFEHNTAHQSGGAVMVNAAGVGSALPIFTNCTLADNRSVRNGGGMARFGGSWVERGPFLQNCRFERNRAGQRGGGIYLNASHGTDSLVLRGCLFEENSAFVAGGGAFFLLGRQGQSFWGAIGVQFIKNVAGQSAALELNSSGIPFDGNIVFDSCNILLNKPNGPNIGTIREVVFIAQEGGGNSKIILNNMKIEANTIISKYKII
ncbi:MAG: hypothetical protein ABMA02_13445 [Saprospiraceae bacterium]